MFSIPSLETQTTEIVLLSVKCLCSYASLLWRPSKLNSWAVISDLLFSSHWNRLPKEAVDFPSLGQAGCGSGQPGLVVCDPAHSRGLKPDEHCGPFQPRPFYDSMIHEVSNDIHKGKSNNSKRIPWFLRKNRTSGTLGNILVNDILQQNQEKERL